MDKQSQTSPPDAPDSQEQKKLQKQILYPTRFITLTIVTFISMLIPLTLFAGGILKLEALSIMLSLIGIAVSNFGWAIPPDIIDRWLQSIIRRLYHRLGLFRQIIANLLYRKDFFISYHSSDSRWATWISWQLQKEGHSVIAGEWEEEKDFLQEMVNATEKAKYILTILSPDYLKMLQKVHPRTEKWIQVFKKRNLPDKRSFSVIIHECKLDELIPINYINLITDKLKARDRLIVKIPYKPFLVKTDLTEASNEPPFPRDFISNIPRDLYSQFFTGRERFLNLLHARLIAGESYTLIRPLAITGLRGIGKTQTALVYADYYRDYYQFVLWVDASSEENIKASFNDIISFLHIPADTQNPVETVKKWLEEQKDVPWLMLFDECNDLELVRSFIPYEGKGHVLLTTHSQNTTKIAGSIGLGPMERNEGAKFLLRRSKPLGENESLDEVKKSDWKMAKTISHDLLGGLPLAIEYAGIYIVRTGCNLESFHETYTNQRADILSRLAEGHATNSAKLRIATIATAWSMSFEGVWNSDRAAADLLRLCAFLSSESSESIPEEIITEAPDLGPDLQPVVVNKIKLDGAIEHLQDFSLISRNPNDGMLIVHRLVHAVIQEGIYKENVPPATQRLWARRAVLAVNKVFPEVALANWQGCQKYLSQAQACIKHIKRWNLRSTEAIHLLCKVEHYFQEFGQYAEAEYLVEMLQEINARISTNAGYPGQATCLNILAEFNRLRGNYEKAESLLQQAVDSVDKQSVGQEIIDKATILNNIGRLYDDWGRRKEAEDCFIKAEQLSHQNSVLNNPVRAISLNNIAGVHLREDKQDSAEKYYTQALEIFKTLGDDNPYVAQCQANLATLYTLQSARKYGEAEKLFKNAIDIGRRTLGVNHPQLAARLNNLAELYRVWGKYADARQYYEEALDICKQYKNKMLKKHPLEEYILENYNELMKYIKKPPRQEREEVRAG